MSLKVSVDTHNAVPVVKIVGRIETAEVDKLARRLAKLVQKNHEEIEIDLRGTEFIDSSGLGILVFHHSQMKKQNRTLTIINDGDANQYVQRLFELTRLNEVFTCRQISNSHSS